MRAIWILPLMIVGLAAAYGCGGSDAYAQSGYEHYVGRRVFIQSLVYDLRDSTKYVNKADGAGSVHIRAVAAAPLTSIDPRVNDSLGGISAVQANKTRVETATTFVSPSRDGFKNDSEFFAKTSIDPGQELAWDYVWLGGEQSDRNYCDVDLGSFGAYGIGGTHSESLSTVRSNFKYRYSTQNCRIRPPITLTGGTLDPGVQSNLDFSRPSISLSWVDRRRNKGEYFIRGFDVIYPAPTVKTVRWLKPITSATDWTEDDQGQSLLDPRTVCEFTSIRLLSIGIQSAKPDTVDAHKGLAGTADDVDYFGGQEGRRVAGLVSSCLLDPPRNLEVILPKMDTFVSEEKFTEYNSKVRAIVKTASLDKIDHTATLVVLDGNRPRGDKSELARMVFAEADDDDYYGIKLGRNSPTYPTVHFNIDASNLNYLDKPEGRPDAPDVGEIAIQIEYTHEIKVERPPLIVTEKISDTPLCFWRTCPQTGRGSRNCGSDDNCKSRCSRRCSGTSVQWFPPSETTSVKYFGEHERIDADALKHKPGDPDAEVTYTFGRTVFFEPIFVTFDEPYEELIYVRPTPAAIFGDRKRQVYWRIGDVIGLRNGEDVRCLEDVDSPWTHVDGKGCRLEVACCIQAPVEEDACGDEISDDEFNCPLLPADERFFSDDDKPADPDDDPDTS